jgi:acetolactate synthase-1/2/3 large subunit
VNAPNEPTLIERTGGRILVDQLLIHGADTAFCVPGESYLDILDALYDTRDRLRLINARHEAGAANMAEAYGKLTGKPGICLVTRGPGACHAAVGVHTAFQDSTPMILLVGQVARNAMDREAFQEIDYRQMFGPVAKWVAQIDLTERIPEYMARAFRVATSGRPGPVVLALPEDMLAASADVSDGQPYECAQPAIAHDEAERIAQLLDDAQRPLLLLGGSGWTDAASADIKEFAEANGLPVATSFRRQDALSNRSSSYVGDFGTSGPPSLIKRMKEVDLLLVVGARLGEMTSQGFSLVDTPNPRQRLIHVHADANEIGRIYAPEIGVVSSVAAFAKAFAGRRVAGGWSGWAETLRREFKATQDVPASGRALDLAQAFTQLDAVLTDDAIVTLDAGNHTGWPQRFLNYGRPGRQIGPTSGAMGYSVPAAVAAALTCPGRLVIGCVGDGGFAMSGLELLTAVQHGGTPIIFVFNNRTYGTIRMHQERHHPERISGTDIANPDFVALALAMGVHAERVERTDQFLPAFERARNSGRPALIELVTDQDQISTRITIEALRKAARPGAGK